MNSSSHGNHYDTVIPNPEAVNTIYDEIPANATDGADMSKEKSSLAAMESCPHNIYDSADGATAVPSDKGEVATEHYECMQAPAAAYSNTGVWLTAHGLKTSSDWNNTLQYTIASVCVCVAYIDIYCVPYS